MQVRLFVDEDAMADALMTGLRARGVNLLTASEAGTRKLKDDDSSSLQRLKDAFFTRSTFLISINCIRHGRFKARAMQGSSSRRNNVTLSASKCAGS
ncbi:MAG TPA: hypothetical protein VN937_04495 [Blastocatellia bacterium]|nr:hypothetical protein [Blastocatellia bacterium]